MYPFHKALKVFPQTLETQMNVSLFFVCEFEHHLPSQLTITGNNSYRVFDNGVLLGYGPARASHGYYRIDQFDLSNGTHRIVIELASYRCNSFYYLNTTPFLQAEITSNQEVIRATGINFECYLNNTRLQKVSRFSYQRTFAEVYVIEQNIADYYLKQQDRFVKLPLDEVKEIINYLPRRVWQPLYQRVAYHPIETGNFVNDVSLPLYSDRYMFLEELKIFPKDTWDDYSSDIASQLRFITDTIDLSHQLPEGSYRTYENEVSLTGFIELDVTCHEDSDLLVIFDEVNQGQSPEIIINFARNTTHNIVRYKFKQGQHHHLSFEPYTAKYLRVIVLSGCISINYLGIIKYENPLHDALTYQFDDQRIQIIMDAATATFAQNAVDILTDCPSRERAGWLCDSYFSAQAELLLTGKNLVEYNFLENYSYLKQYETLPQGMIPMCYPGEFPDGTFIPNWSLFYILELEDLKKRNNQSQLIENSLLNVRNILSFFKRYENSDEMLEDLPGWVFVEWSKANDPSFIEGVNFPSNMLYAAALRASSILLDDDQYRIKAERLIAKIRRYSYNGRFFTDNMIKDSKGQYISTDHTSEVCQYYAFYFGIANMSEYPQLYETLLNDFGPYRDYTKVFPEVAKSNAFIGNYLRLTILLRNNESQLVLDETIAYFEKMAQLTGTLWEHDSIFASLNHGFASFISHIVIYAIFGIEKIDYIHHKIYIKQPHPKYDGQVTIPTDQGFLYLKNQSGVLSISGPFEVVSTI